MRFKVGTRVKELLSGQEGVVVDTDIQRKLLKVKFDFNGLARVFHDTELEIVPPTEVIKTFVPYELPHEHRHDIPVEWTEIANKPNLVSIDHSRPVATKVTKLRCACGDEVKR